ncbi:MAG TPA: hypothetical protein VLI41_14340 [Phenylobacterium sp.]|uniref:hypothetical protein n=1 Tax=Phenylobacterium sp. TaxID=1871053 RepID=UPI002BDCAA6D|nr:hypothetical protein [Phenylobacterium sp.]HSV04371.1 hypothetical protein [Phenylobacterium sp.]
MAQPAELDIGRVIRDIVGVLQRNLAVFALLAAILVGVPAVLTGAAHTAFLSAGDWSRWPSMALAGLVRLVASLILQAALIYGTVTDLNGRRASVGQCLSVGLNDFLPLFAIGLLAGLAIAVGLVLLVVPGLILAVMWCVAVPAFVAERMPVMESFGRSARLTEGNRWRIFALFVVFLLASLVLGAVLGAVTAFTPFAFREIVVQPIVAVITGLVGATGAAVLYVELRRAKEGVDPARIATGFEARDGAPPPA